MESLLILGLLCVIYLIVETKGRALQEQRAKAKRIRDERRNRNNRRQ